ncbi:MAG TPA: RtcB family protein [Candidatus Omnitrophota bacterium]|nr:RtcB family protein [Candidatus Omnitrophota bacterium]HPN56223.1 RtcB family protein [Candidatus Omnitrophota bacterium]
MPLPRDIKRVAPAVWELSQDHSPGMNVPARIYATEALLRNMEAVVFDQVANVAKLPGIQKYAFCMPDGHWGYGFPIGGVAAMRPDDGVISPGGIGFDINCGMRLVKTNLTYEDVQPRLKALVDRLFQRVPSGVGGASDLDVSKKEFRRLVEQGASWCVARGWGWPDDLDKTEESGCLRGADSGDVSDKAVSRGYQQVGTLGSGNHYLEIQVLKPENIFCKEYADALGLNIPHQVVVMFHCGSRGFGHQVATDYLQIFLKVMKSKYGLDVIDRELSCAPFRSQEGQAYFSAMKCAVNMAFANRQVILHRIREVFSEVFQKKAEDLGMQQIYDVAHNIAKLETHPVDGRDQELLVHRKGSTRAFGPGRAGLPDVYRKIGQPVIIGGSMETGSYLLTGVEGSAETFCSTAHGSGRTMSRHKARGLFQGRALLEQMRVKGIYVNTSSLQGLAEEAGAAYKNIDDVTDATEMAGISKRVARFIPVGNIKG